MHAIKGLGTQAGERAGERADDVTCNVACDEHASVEDALYFGVCLWVVQFCMNYV
jgi:hypothetical protein